MRVFMLGWEFPPFISGGLGTACYGLTKAMSGLGTDIMFVLPRPVSTPFSTHVRLVSPRSGSPLASPSTEFRLDEFEHVTFRTIDAQLGDPYQSAAPIPVKQPLAATKQLKATVVDQSKFPEPTAVQPTMASAATPSFIGATSSSPGAQYAGDLFSEI